MLAEGVVGLIAGAQAHSIAVIAWAIGSAVEAAAAVIVLMPGLGWAKHRLGRRLGSDATAGEGT
jgi:divalent metal cation (Fe/Co/Zn/Cd) transporter